MTFDPFNRILKKEYAFFCPKTFSRFILIGASNTLLAYIIFIVAYHFTSPYSLTYAPFISQGLSYALAMLWSYHWNRKWSFKVQNKHRYQFVFFVLSQIFFMITSSTSIHLLIQDIELSPTFSWVLTMGFVTILNYLALKMLVFKEAK